MSKRETLAPHAKAILREVALVPREWLRFGKTDIARAMLVYGSLVKIYAPFGGGNALARLKDQEHIWHKDSTTGLGMRKVIEKTAQDEANHRPLDLVEIDNPINTFGVNLGCPNCSNEYDLGCYDVVEELYRRNRK